MQIHELTHNQPPVNEASVMGALKGAGALLGGVAKGVVQQAAQSQGINTDDRFAGQRVAPGQRRDAAMAANMPALQLMSKQAQQAWVQTQQQLAQKSNPPAPSAAYLPTDTLKKHLTALITKLVGFDYNTEFNTANPTPGTALAIKNARNTINQNVDEILKLTKEKPEQAKQPLQAAWDELIIKGVGPMQTYVQNAYSTGGTGAAPATQQTDPAVQALLKSITQVGQVEIQKLVQGKMLNKTNIPALDGLLTTLGAKVQ